MGKLRISRGRIALYFIILTGLLLQAPAYSFGNDAVCARVKIEVKQELTLERQAFDAHMRINNGLSQISLQDVRVDVSFADEDANPVLASSDPDNTEALFFIRLDSMENIDDVSGSGSVDPATTADIHWLIIPAPGSANGLEQGTLYYVGAKLTYTIGGEEKLTEVTPDYIFVKPMPQITLDYFLPGDVYGDDTFTAEIEPPVPFALGVRVGNSGFGVARHLKIDSAQPKIVANEQGLLIGFAIQGSEVNGQAAGDSLLVDFGDLNPGRAATARWIMTCTLSGRFVEFDAGFSHSDELGGELTSLITDANTHFLVRDVRVDLPGRDGIRDFLAKDADLYRVYESDAVDTQVIDQSADSGLQMNGNTGAMTTETTAGFIYISLPDPFNGQKMLAEVIRSDGKIIKPENAWLSKTREGSGPWQHFVNLFDGDTTGTYTVKFAETSALPQPPVLQFIEDQTGLEDQQLAFVVQASDPDGPPPLLSAEPLPHGAAFVDQGNGTGIFDWTPAVGQGGRYEINFRASDGTLQDSQRVVVIINAFNDTDSDGMRDDWEMEHFGTLNRDGTGDFDRDGIPDLDEFLEGSDPASMADLLIRTTVDDINQDVGDPAVLTVTVTNNGPRDAAGVQVTDILPSGLRFLSDDAGGRYDSAGGIWDIGELPANSTVRMRISAEVIQQGKIINIAAITACERYDPERSNNSCGIILNAAGQSDLAVETTVDDSVPDAADIVDVIVKVTNNGFDPASGVQVTDVLSPGLTHELSTPSRGSYNPLTGLWEVGGLDVEESATLHLTLTANHTNEIVHTAAITRSDQTDPDPTNNRSSVVINQDVVAHDAVADLALYTASNQNAVNVGDRVVFTLVVRNNGPADAGDVEIDRVLPDGLTYLSAEISQGAYDDQSRIWQVGAIPAAAYVVMDTIVKVTAAGAQASSASVGNLDESDPDAENDSDAATVTGLAADISVTTSVDEAAPNQKDTIVFTITATNNGPDDAFEVTITEQWPSQLKFDASTASQGNYDPAAGLWSIDELTPGSHATLQITAIVEASGQIISRASKTASSPTDLNAENDSDEVTLMANAPPVLSEISGQSIAEGATFAQIELDRYITDQTNEAAEMTWTYNGNTELEVTIDENRMATIIVPHMDWYGSETITFRATDPGGLFAENSAVFTVTAVNDAPLNRVPGAQTTDEDTDLVLSPSISISDVDAFSGDVALTLSSTHGVLTLSTADNLEFDDGDGTDDAAMRFTGSITAINIALDGMRFDPAADYFGAAAVQIRTDDLGHSGAGGSQSDTDRVNITVNAVNDLPLAFVVASFSANEGQRITFSGSAADIDSETLTYFWDFNYTGTFTADADGIELDSPSWTYDDEGTYTVALRVEDEAGGISEIVFGAVTVNNVAPTAQAGEDQMAEEGAPVRFGASFTDPGADTHTIVWDFGDGSSATGTLTTEHTYADNGIYPVTLTVTDDDGGVGTDTLTVSVNNAAPTISELTGNDPSNGKIHFSAAFMDKGWLDTHSCVFEFGDGTASTGEVAEEHEEPDATGSGTVTHHYSEEGIHTVSLSVVDDDGAGSKPHTIEVIIDNTPPVVTILAPTAGYYDNTREMTVDFEVEDPVSNGVSSGLVEDSVVAFLDGQRVADGQVIDLSELTDGLHTVKVQASDYAGNRIEAEVIFEVGPAPAMVHIKPRQWSLSWLDPFGDFRGKKFGGGFKDRGPITAYISTENVAVETILPTFATSLLTNGSGYGDFVVVGMDAAQDGRRHGAAKIRSVTLQYAGTDEIDILAFSGDKTWDFYSVNQGDFITIDAGEGEHLSRYTILSSYKSDSPFYSAADILPETVRLNGTVPIIAQSAELITKQLLQLGQSRVIAEAPFAVVREGRHHVWLTNLGDPQQITLEAGGQTIFEDAPYPLVWHDRFRLEEDGQLQSMGIYASRHKDILRVFHHNLAEQARIYLDGMLALTILPEVKLVALRVQFDRFDAVSSLAREDLARGGDWKVTTHEGVRLLSKQSGKHVTIYNLGDPQKIKLVVGDTVIFEDKPFPIRWKDRYFIVDGERQDLSIYTFGRLRRSRYLSIHCRKLTREAKLYLDEELVLQISPPPEIEVSLSGDLEFDGDRQTFDGSFRGTNEIKLEGRIPSNYDPDQTYQRIDTSGSPALEIGDRFGEFEVVNFTEEYDDYRITVLDFTYEGWRKANIAVYEDHRRKGLIGNYEVYPGATFSVDVSDVDGDRVYLRDGKRQHVIYLEGRSAADFGDHYLGCTVIDTVRIPVGPPHYIDLTLEFMGTAGPIAITAYEGQWKAVIGTHEVDPAFDPTFTIDGSGQPRGHIGDNLVLEYGDAAPFD